MRLLLLLTPLLLCCETVPVVTAHPVPPADRLKPADCDLGVTEYRRRLDLAPPPVEGTAALEARFRTDCAGRLAGRARRVIVRCWHDAADAAAVLACNDRF